MEKYKIEITIDEEDYIAIKSNLKHLIKHSSLDIKLSESCKIENKPPNIQLMTPEEKAIAILEKINNGKISKELLENCSDYTKKDLKRKVFIVIDEIESALIEYGNDSMELQNMDSEFRYWDSVREAVKSF